MLKKYIRIHGKNIAENCLDIQSFLYLEYLKPDMNRANKFILKVNRIKLTFETRQIRIDFFKIMFERAYTSTINF